MEIWFAVIAAAGALATSLVALYRVFSVDKPKAQSDANVKVVMAATELVDDLRQELQRRQEAIIGLEQKRDEQHTKALMMQYELLQCWERITALESQVENLETN